MPNGKGAAVREEAGSDLAGGGLHQQFPALRRLPVPYYHCPRGSLRGVSGSLERNCGCLQWALLSTFGPTARPTPPTAHLLSPCSPHPCLQGAPCLTRGGDSLEAPASSLLCPLQGQGRGFLQDQRALCAAKALRSLVDLRRAWGSSQRTESKSHIFKS